MRRATSFQSRLGNFSSSTDMITLTFHSCGGASPSARSGSFSRLARPGTSPLASGSPVCVRATTPSIRATSASSRASKTSSTARNVSSDLAQL